HILAHRRLQAVDIDHQLSTRAKQRCERGEGGRRGGSVMEDAFREDEIEALARERQREDVGLDERGALDVSEALLRCVDGLGDVDADELAAVPAPTWSEPRARGQSGPAAGVQYPLTVAEVRAHRLPRLESIALEDPRRDLLLH